MAIAAPAFLQPLSVRVVTSLADFPGDSQDCFLLQDFIASAPRNSRVHCAAVSGGDRALGVICGHEACFGPFRSGAVTLDLALSWFSEGAPDFRRRAIRAAVRVLLAQPGVRRLRVRVEENGSDAQAVQDAVRDQRFRALAKTCDGESVLRITEIAGALREECLAGPGMSYVPQIPDGAFRNAVWDLLETGVSSPSLEWTVPRCMALIDRAERPFLTGVRRPDGEWLSLAGGWFEENCLVFAFQLSKADDGFAAAELRHQTVKHLAAVGDVAEIRFLGNLAGVLGTFTSVCSFVEIAIEKTRPMARLWPKWFFQKALHP